MRWYHLFSLRKYISKLESNIFSLQMITSSNKKSLEEMIDTMEQLEKRNVLLEGKLTSIEKYFTNKPKKNEIEDQAEEEIELTEDIRFPVMDGIKVRFDGEDPKKSFPINIYGQGTK